MTTWRLVTRPSSKLKNLGDIWSLVRASSQRSRSSSIVNKLFIALPFFFFLCRWFSRNPISRARTRTSCNILMPLGFICYLRNHFIRSLIRRKKCAYVAFFKKNLFLVFFWHLFIYFFIYLFIFICLFILHPGHSHPQPNFFFYPTPIPSSSISTQGRTGLPWKSIKHGISSCTGTVHLPMY